MDKKKLLCLLIIILLPHATQANEKENLYSQLNRAIIRLEHFEILNYEGSKKIIKQNKPDGTAFFVRNGSDLFVVSARHVVEQPYDLHARVECLKTKSDKKEIVLLKLPRERWIFHPNNGSKDTHFVDIAAMKIKWIKDRTIKTFRYESQGTAEEKENQLPVDDPIPPRDILVFGFPMDIGFQLLEQRPLGRSGIIAMQTGKKFLKMNMAGSLKFAEDRCYVIDAEAFPGNSGSPIMNKTSLLDSKLQLLGILSAANERMDYAIAEPVSRVREVLELAIKQKDKENFNYWSIIH